MRSEGLTKPSLYLLFLPLNLLSHHDQALQAGQEFQLLHPLPDPLALLARPEKKIKNQWQKSLQVRILPT